jgi:hypothetical protein
MTLTLSFLVSSLFPIEVTDFSCAISWEKKQTELSLIRLAWRGVRHEVKDTRVPPRMHFSTFSFIFTTSNATTEYCNDSIIKGHGKASAMMAAGR